MAKANPLAAALALGIFWGLCVFLTTLTSVAIGGYGTALTNVFDSIYPGYSVSIGGSILGLFYGLVDGFIIGFLVVWLYNRFTK
jgi:hypothetical protein